MTSIPTGGGLEEVRAYHRLLILELLVTGIVLAGLVNLFSGSLHNFLTSTGNDRSVAWWWTKLYGGLLTLVVAIFIAILWRQKVVEVNGLTLMLPVHVYPEKPRAAILSHDYYQPAFYAHRFFARPGPEFRQRFKNAWRGPNPFTAPDFGPGHFCWDAIMQLSQALVVQLLKFYGELSLTPTAYVKSEFRRLAGRLKATPLEQNRWPQSLQANLFLSSTPSQDIKSLLVPKSGKIAENYPRPLPKERPGRRDWLIDTPFGVLLISFSPNWTIMTASGRERALKEFPEATDQTCFLLIPVEMRLIIKRFYISGEKMHYHYWWFQKLMDNMRRRLSWGYFLRSRGIPEEDY